MKKNIVFIGMSISLLVLLGIGFSYSMWNITVNQDSVSTMHTDCFDLTISNKENNISLENAYPISNSKGMKLTPYTFTVTNTCDITAQYSINLEVLKESTLSSDFIDVMLDGNINLLSSYDKTTRIDNTSIESRKIDTGILKSNESKDYSLRLWIDYDTTLEDLNNESKIFKSKIVVAGKPINYEGDTVFNFDYTGAEQSFMVPVSGTYKLETWGAQGGGTLKNGVLNKIGGNGGYSSGLIKLKIANSVYINVGGIGADGAINVNDSVGGYNGGGIGHWDKEDDDASGGGGGATHIATRFGLLSTLENYKSEILIVSGGGGGSAWTYVSGTGGGYIGSNGYNNWNNLYSVGGNQNFGYKFGIGGSGSDCTGTPGGGGGGGYYGGFGGYISDINDHYNDAIPGGGGSGYIGNNLLTNKIMYCYNCEESSEVSTKTVSTTCSEETPTSYCAKKGNGYARITLVSIDE